MAERVNTGLELYKWSHAAATMPEDKNWKGYALEAMGNQYGLFGIQDDPIIQKALTDSAINIRKGQSMVPEVFDAIRLYHDKAENALAETTVAHMIKFARAEGYKTDLPENAKTLMRKYGNTKVGDLDLENNEEHKKVAITIRTLYNQIDRGQLLPQLIRENTEKTLESIFQ